MNLKLYQKKRDFELTSEPSGSKKSKASFSRSFVVQKHAASHLHYDFRLEVDGVLKSWAVPKGPSLNPSQKRLAMMVEDHPYDYKDFEGVIPPGNYGAGTVMVWDQGVYYPITSGGKNQHQFGDESTMVESLEKGRLTFFLEGEKLRGLFSLVKLKKQEDRKENSWLLMKIRDAYASEKDIIQEDRSVVTHRTLEEIAGGIRATNASSVSKKSVQKAKMPHNIKPMLAFLANEPFNGEDWLFEVKWDGFRAIAEVNRENVQLYSRTQQSFNEHFFPIVEALKELDLEVVLDGEIVIVDKEGRSHFQLLQNYQKTGKGELRYYVFDLLYDRGEDLRQLPLWQRKERLKRLLPSVGESIIQFSDQIEKRGIDFFKKAQEKGLEGIIAKKKESSYQDKRSRDWLKIKTHARQEVVICGFTAPRGSRKEFGSLIMGVYDQGNLRFVGHVGGGFTGSSLSEMMKKLKPLITEKCPFSKIPSTNNPVTWVKPKLVGEVSFHEWTDDFSLRQPIFVGLREDKNPKEVKREYAVFEANSIPEEREDLHLTHLNKIYWPKEGYTKGDLIDYYRTMAPIILPYLKDRPQTLYRFPNGIESKGFYQKNIDKTFPDWISTFPIHHSHQSVNYLLIPDERSLLFVANLGSIDLHPFSSRIQQLDYPDYLVLDLDPEEISFDAVIETALVLHEILSSFDIPHFCKTSGATGMHLYLPLGARYTYEQTKQFAHILAQLAHEKLPKITSLERLLSKRQKRVYIDYLQNNFGQTVVAPYSVRPRPGCPVSTPLDWKEVRPGLNPLSFTMQNTPERLKKKGDLFADLLKKGIDLKKILKKLE